MNAPRCLAVSLLLACAAMADDATIASHLAKPSLNVVITVSDMDKATEFYGKVLGLEAMSPIPFGENTDPVFFPSPITMQRFKVGGHEIKLIPGIDSTKKIPKGGTPGVGIQLVNYPIKDIEAFKARLAEHGYDEPAINAMPGSTYRFGMIDDPDGNQVEFFYYDGDGPEGWQETIHIGLNVADVEATRNFYGKVLGIPEMPSIPSPMGNGTIYLFQNGPTLVKFWAAAKDAPNHAGRHLDAYGYRYIQYALNDIDSAYAFVQEQGATIDLPPTTLFRGMPIKIMFVADPNGIINEMFGTSR